MNTVNAIVPLLVPALEPVLYGVVASVDNENPVAAFSSAAGADTLTFDFTDESTDGDGSIVSWAWDFGDGSGTSTDQHPSYSYTVQGVKTVRLTVTDDRGGTHFVEHDVTPLPVMPTIFAVGTEVEGIAAATIPCPGVYANGHVWVIDVATIGTEVCPLPTHATLTFAEMADSPRVGAVSRVSRFWARISGVVTPGSGLANAAIADPGNHHLAVPYTVLNSQLTGSPIGATVADEGALDTSVEWPADSTPHANGLVVCACATTTDTDTPDFSAPTAGGLDSIAVVANAATSQGAGSVLGIYAGPKAAAGSWGNPGATLTTAAVQQRHVVSFLGRGSV
jgi:PKD repeat protein